MRRYFTVLLLIILSPLTHARAELWNYPDWSAEARLGVEGERGNIYEQSPEAFAISNRQGRIHSLWYDLPVTGLKVPFHPIKILTTPREISFRNTLEVLFGKKFDFFTTDDLYALMGLKTYPETERENEAAYFVPFRNGVKPVVRMGITTIHGPQGEYVTASCTACHSENLFGKRVIGLTNKVPMANTAFEIASKLVPKVSPQVLRLLTGITTGEMEMWNDMQDAFQWIGVKNPQVMGLDTSVATVSLSLSKRGTDPHATIHARHFKNPRFNVLEKFVADSKPMPWFVLKYKTRWLSDGSVVSGNPILTNFLWNEIGRGVDLKKLSSWVDQEDSKKKIVDLTTAVFGTTPPRYTDFFPAHGIDLNRAKRGQTLFNQSCFQCHGTYDKAWDDVQANTFTAKELLETVKVHYPERTQVKDVGTDPNRYVAMRYLGPELNRLAISQKMGIKVVSQTGYVPPPLVGIWSRWPYFHNNSAPTLCDVLSHPSERRKTWYVGAPLNPTTDFDSECNGYPSLEKAPKSWHAANRLFDTRKAGLSNSGHYKHAYTPEEKKDLIQFLKTL